MRFDLPDAPPRAAELRRELRDFLAEAGRDWTPDIRARSWMGFDRGFSRAVGARGWIGMTWPAAYGGHEKSGLERIVVLEEMLAAGAPVGAHWIGDRQSGPLILRLGTEEQRRRILPGIARGELAFCIGLSEPEAGSDLANLRTKAERVPNGWKLNGRKIWTTFAHKSDYMIALVRTSPAPEGRSRHAGLSQFLVDLRLSGISIRPIRDLVGEESFNEVTFDDVMLREDDLLGEEGAGWAQATSELAFERSGPDRYLSSYPALAAGIDALNAAPVPGAEATIGRMVARLNTLRGMSLSVGGMLERGESPAVEAALVKDVGNVFEQALPEQIRSLMDPEDMPPDLRLLLDDLVQLAPTFSLRGGTREILRGIIARELGLR
ncbi:acyl-CoA dehydrogenase family protein [Sediminicoccus rosea]|jgi:alkylation response protein AidB-like acyl-CoA dehydrogenase|uniref:Acyl-CoA dehydrogenase family protein n=1 Tax=Sediminicoccus rosea TaxID=1225128 RepID=A0ABZ0PCH1_9PROT|nr:acyl-CoA dehydrogenase family protein [Sediminicoccus rosea]WPB83297.1 acyl-CoA dehydrogenase family protein [Sediminicoccus rosea]